MMLDVGQQAVSLLQQMDANDRSGTDTVSVAMVMCHLIHAGMWSQDRGLETVHEVFGLGLGSSTLGLGLTLLVLAVCH